MSDIKKSFSDLIGNTRCMRLKSLQLRLALTHRFSQSWSTLIRPVPLRIVSQTL